MSFEQTIRDGMSENIRAQGYVPFWKHQDAPMPKTPFVSLYMLTMYKVNYDELLSPNSDGVSVVGGTREAVVSVQANGESATNIAQLLRDFFSKKEAQSFFEARNLAFVSATPVRQLPVVKGSSIERRAGFDVTIRGTSEQPNAVGLITNTSPVGTYN